MENKDLKTLEQTFEKTKYFNEIYKIIFIYYSKSSYLIDYKFHL